MTSLPQEQRLLESMRDLVVACQNHLLGSKRAKMVLMPVGSTLSPHRLTQDETAEVVCKELAGMTSRIGDVVDCLKELFDSKEAI